MTERAAERERKAVKILISTKVEIKQKHITLYKSLLG